MRKLPLLLILFCLCARVASAQSNLVLLISSPGDYIGQGKTYYTTNPAEFSASLYTIGPLVVQVTAFGFFMNFAGPDGTAPSVGNYTNAVRYPFHGSNPGLSISGNGRGCNSVCGSFQVFEVQTNSSGTLTRFWATFSQRCECTGSALTGEIRFNSLLAPPTPLSRVLRVPSDFPTIQAAINNANVLAVDRVLVDPGLYEESVQFGAGRVQLVSAKGASETYIMATGGVAIAVGGAPPEALISGFTLMDSATGISISSGGAPTIVSNAFVNCGNGIICNSGSPIIRSNSIIGCLGSAIQLSFTGTPLIEGNAIEDNRGGIGMFEAGNPTIQRNVIRRNHGDGMSMGNNCNADILQNLIVDNDGNGIYWLSPAGARGPWVINNTIVGNGGSGITSDSNDQGERIFNNIIVGNPAILVGGAPPEIQFNNVYARNGIAYSGITNLTGLNGNISTEPFFVCEPSGDFHLLPASPCIEAGTNGAPLLPAADFDGGMRILAGHTNGPISVDAGAFEFNPSTAITNPCEFVYCPANMVVITVPGTNSAVVNYPAPLATPGAVLSNVPPSGSLFPAGTNFVTSMATYGTNTLTCTFTIAVLVPPSITGQPQWAILPAGATTNLSVSAAGSEPLRYQWSFETMPLPGATNATLTLTNLQAANEGYYRATVTNQAGSVSSVPALVRVQPAAPSILSGPASLTVSAGSNAIFNVTLTGSEPIWFQWFHDGTALPLSTTSQLVVSNAQAADAGAYFVVVSNALGSATSGTVNLSVLASAPKFVVQPVGPFQGFLPAGTDYTLNALARGSEPIAYQWRRNGANLPGATNTFLVLSNVNTGTNGSYTVVATNTSGAVTSLVASISVLGGTPFFTQQPASIEALEGATVSLNSLANGGNPITYQWHFYGTNLPGQTNRQLSLSPISLAMAGPYHVTASNGAGSTDSLTALVTVNQSLIITQHLTNQVIDLGETATLAIGVSSTGAVNYTWQFNGVAIPGSNSVLTMDNIGQSQSGYYRVVVANSYGSLASTGRVSVFGVPSTVVAWGDSAWNQTNVPPDLSDAVMVSGGDYHSLALRHDGSLAAWGYNGNGQTSAPSNSARYVSIAVGADHNLAITTNGSIVAWGRNDSGQCVVPAQAWPAISVAAGDSHSLALRFPGNVVAWGDNSFGQTSLPFGLTLVRAIACGRHHNLALRQNGTIGAWGLNTSAQASPPPDLDSVAAIAAGYLHSMALRSNGTVVVWGDNTYGQTNVPAQLTNVVAIAAGDFHSVALTASGEVVAWGNNWLGQTNVPPSAAGAWNVASGYYHGLVLRSLPRLHLRTILNGFVIEWQGPGTLQWAFTPTGPYHDLQGFSQSYTNSQFSDPAKFFRLRR